MHTNALRFTSASVIVLFLAGSFAMLAHGDESAGSLLSGPANQWVQIENVETGGRRGPMFVYVPALKQFVLTGGIPGGNYARAKLHFDTEQLDAASLQWTNAYPDGAPYKAASNVTDAPVVAKKDGKPKEFVVKDANGVQRIRRYAAAYNTDTRAHYQWAFDSNAQKLYAVVLGNTYTYDPRKREWTDTGAGGLSKGRWAMIWGSLCYDPINKEIVSCGGSSDEAGGTPSTHVYKIAEKTWTKLDVGSEPFNALRAQAEQMRRDAWGLITLGRNRYFIAETKQEAQADLQGAAKALAAAVHALSAEIAKANLRSSEAPSAQKAREALADAVECLKLQDAALGQPVTAELLAGLRPAYEACLRAERALDAQPTGRAHSQMVFDAASGKIVLFGGGGLDCAMSDTWVYDCKRRTWEQRWPEVVPSPRQGHAMVYLPKSQRVALIGGHTIDGWFKPLPHQVWSYDVAKNRWQLLASTPLAEKGQPATFPTGSYSAGAYDGSGSGLVAASTGEDLVVAVDTGPKGRSTWAAHLDPTKPDLSGTAALGVPAASISRSMKAEEYDKAAVPDTARMETFLEQLPKNQWTRAPDIAKRPSFRAWNSSTYDPERKQILLWGGGHVTYMGTEVSHYSLRSGLWSISYGPDLPHAPSGGFSVKAALSFASRPQIPVHAYQAYAYDPTSDKMHYFDRAYDVVRGEWDAASYPGLKHHGVMRSMLESTPHGVFCFSQHGLYRFDADKQTWGKAPWNGPAWNGRVWCDGHAMFYDSKRDCLWLANKTIFRYDLKTGNVEKLDVQVPKVLGKFALWREQVYLPDADLVLLMRLFPDADGKLKNVVWSPETGKYSFVELPFAIQGKPVTYKKNPYRWSAALFYDHDLGVAILHRQREPFFLKFDKKGATMVEIRTSN